MLALVSGGIRKEFEKLYFSILLTENALYFEEIFVKRFTVRRARIHRPDEANLTIKKFIKAESVTQF